MKSFCAALGLLFLCVVSLGRGQNAANTPSLWYNPLLLLDPVVQQDLKLNSNAARLILLGMSNAKAAGGGPTSVEAYNSIIEGAVDKLKPAQRKRLHQITLQSYGAFALCDPKVQAELGMTAQQRRAFMDFAGKRGKLLGASFDDPNVDKAKSKAMEQESRRESAIALRTVLTNKQRLKWRALQGKPLNLTSLAELTAAPARR